MEAGFSSLISPEMSCTVMWLLKRWTATYLSLQEKFYAEISMVLVTAFGQNTEGAAWTINFLLAKIISNLTHFYSEPQLVEDTVQLLIVLVDAKEKYVFLITFIHKLLFLMHSADP